MFKYVCGSQFEVTNHKIKSFTTELGVYFQKL